MNYKIGLSANLINKDPAIGIHDGLSVYTKNLRASLEKAGADVVPYQFKHAGPDFLAGIKSLDYAYKTYVGLGAISSKLLTAKPQVDIFHVTDYCVAPMSCPVVTTLYDAIPFVQPEFANSRLRKLKNILMRRMASYSDQVIAISKFSVAELVAHYRVPENKISVVPCGVDQVWLQPIEAEQVEAVLNRRKQSRGYFLTVGTIQPRKNLERVLEAHNLLPNSMRVERPLVVVGRARWNCEHIIERLVAKCQKNEAVWLRDVESSEELRCLYAGAGAFVFPSLYEGFGLPVLEAFASGLLVVTSNTTSLQEVSEGIALEVNPLSVGEIAEAMKSVVNDTGHSWRLEAGRTRAMELSWDQCAKSTIAVYDAVLNNA